MKIKSHFKNCILITLIFILFMLNYMTLFRPPKSGFVFDPGDHRMRIQCGPGSGSETLPTLPYS
jgi:hypothetical protein